ncbi:conserved hypothetical protein [uncultured Desulfobacterium sp.]|uniref:Uncharacterized protein n=1 Tax=uncultured Desulfobacterium sp. TaxID=201089 RepID=A0A445MQU0_9BACT|nr:conserved hypothetical protein [uncultured Desulfobacterium sp.]
MTDNGKNEIYEYGVHVYRARHEKIRALKRLHSPRCHGFRVWPSSWLLMDFFERTILPKGTRVIEVGCGWGLSGIYCAKKFEATVTGADKDPEVFPYLLLHAEINRTPITTLNKGFDELTCNYLKDIDVLIGSDICFWDSMVRPLETLVGRALDMGVKLVLISDPGRLPFDKLGENLSKNMSGEMRSRSLHHPYSFEGKIFKIGTVPF